MAPKTAMVAVAAVPGTGAQDREQTQGQNRTTWNVHSRRERDQNYRLTGSLLVAERMKSLARINYPRKFFPETTRILDH